MVSSMTVFDYLKIKNQYVLLKYRLSVRSNEDTERIRENYRSFLAVLESVRGTSDMPLVNRPNRAERRRRVKENRK